MENFPVAKKEKDPNELLQKAILEADSIEIKGSDRNALGELLAPNGEKSNLENDLYWKIVRTQSFKEWFGDWQYSPHLASGAVDQNGEPLLVYHSSNKVFSEFNPKKSSFALCLGKGAYFTPDLYIAENYGNIFYTCFINTKNLIKVEGDSKNNFLKNLYYSFVRPKDTALFTESGPDTDHSNQFCVLHKENILIVPSTNKL